VSALMQLTAAPYATLSQPRLAQANKRHLPCQTTQRLSSQPLAAAPSFDLHL